MQEIEVKILDVNVQKLQKNLVKLGAQPVGKYKVKTATFDTEQKEILAKRGLLRLRKKNEKTFLTYKSKVVEGKTKTCEETEIEVNDFETTAKLLKELGFIQSTPFHSKRITYKIKNSLVEIDIYKEIPPYFEIESPNEKELEEIVKLLGYTMKDTISWNGWQVFAHYGKKLEG